MKNKIRKVVLLITLSLFSIFCLQIYYAIEVYQQKSGIFHDEVNRPFEKAVEKTNEQRLRKINQSFEQDISDTTQVKLVYELLEDGPKLVIIDPNTGLRHLTTTIERVPDSFLDRSDLIQIAPIPQEYQLFTRNKLVTS